MQQLILIVEDHPIFRDALRLSLQSRMPECRWLTANSLVDAKRVVAEHHDIDLILLDLWLPDTKGYEGLIELRSLKPKTPVVILSAFADEVVIDKTIVLGAAGFIPKASKLADVERAIQQVLEGEVYVPYGYSPPARVNSEDLDALANRLKSLTTQQLRVLDLLCQGQLNKQIAHELHVGETTVKAHVSEILRKLNVASRTQAVIEVSKLDLHAISAFYEH